MLLDPIPTSHTAQAAENRCYLPEPFPEQLACLNCAALNAESVASSSLQKILGCPNSPLRVSSGYWQSFLAERPKAMSRRLNEFLGVAPHRSTPATAFMLRLPIAPEACFEASAWRASLGVAIVVPIKEQPCARTKCRWRGATPNYFHVRCGSYRTSARVAGRGRRQTMTGMALCVSTLRVSLPSTMADTPRRP